MAVMKSEEQKQKLVEKQKITNYNYIPLLTPLKSGVLF